MIESRYLIDKDEDTLDLRPRLTLNTSDQLFFRTHIVERVKGAKRAKRTNPLHDKSLAGKPPPKDSHKNIAGAGQLVSGFVSSHVDGCRHLDAINRLKRIIAYIRDHVKFISVIVPSDEDAYTIFETLNDRGLDLSKADLLKNHLFRASGSQQNEVESKWNAMTGALETVSRRDITVDYLRYLWISSRGHVREKQLYKVIKNEVSEQGQVVEFAHDLADSAILYAAILNSDHSRWDQYGEEAKTDLSNLIMLGIERMRPITLAVGRIFKPQELRKAIYYLVCASVRILIASPSPGGVFEQQVADIAPFVNNGTIKTAKELANEMNKKIVPDDASFEAQFAVASVSQTNLARYYFRAMENANIEKGDPVPARVAKAQMKGTLEHIMPVNPSVAWAHVPPDIAKAYYKWIGNLALLEAKMNVDIGNEDFRTVKIPAYKKSVLTLTRELCKVKGEWDADQIEKRQKRLAAIAVRTWTTKVV